MWRLRVVRHGLLDAHTSRSCFSALVGDSSWKKRVIILFHQQRMLSFCHHLNKYSPRGTSEETMTQHADRRFKKFHFPRLDRPVGADIFDFWPLNLTYHTLVLVPVEQHRTLLEEKARPKVQVHRNLPFAVVCTGSFSYLARLRLTALRSSNYKQVTAVEQHYFVSHQFTVGDFGLIIKSFMTRKFV